MKVTPGSVVSLSYDICTEEGEIVESSEIGGTISFVHGRGAIIPGLDKKLVGMDEGEERTFTFPPTEAFGQPEDAPKKGIKRSEFPADAKLEKGASFEAGIPGGHKIRLEVVEISAQEVTVRMIHPLAGKTITMNVAVRKVRPATPAETASGIVQAAPPPPLPK